MSQTQTIPTDTELEKTAALDVIPSEDDIEVVGGSARWRFANGKIVRGQEREVETTVEGKTVKVPTGNYPEERASVIGKLDRVGVFDHVGKFGRIFQIEADIITAEGVIEMKASLLDTNGLFKLTGSARGFAWALTQFTRGELMRLAAEQGEAVILPNGQKGGRPTFVNAFRIEGNKALRIFRPKHEGTKPTDEESWDLLEPQLRAHPAYKERIPAHTDEADGCVSSKHTHYGAFVRECEDKRWPTPDQAPATWSKMIAAFLKMPKVPSSLAMIPEDDWGAIRLALKDQLDCPKMLVEDQQRLAAAGATEEYDPFA